MERLPSLKILLCNCEKCFTGPEEDPLMTQNELNCRPFVCIFFRRKYSPNRTGVRVRSSLCSGHPWMAVSCLSS